jgi:predicted  nucleic acid-binding Zn-ribbon protein
MNDTDNWDADQTKKMARAMERAIVGPDIYDALERLRRENTEFQVEIERLRNERDKIKRDFADLQIEAGRLRVEIRMALQKLDTMAQEMRIVARHALEGS